MVQCLGWKKVEMRDDGRDVGKVQTKVVKKDGEKVE
jgi:hypothetical protein